MYMDAIFLLDNGARTTFLQQMLQSLGGSYISLWSCLPEQPNCLRSIDGFYSEENNQMPSSSAGSLAQRLFNNYRELGFNVENDHVPGFAFKTGLPYMELKELDLQRLASAEAQLQFYREARIKTAIFMGCRAGEIELGMSNESQVNIEMEMKKYCFPEDFSRSQPLLLRDDIPFPTDQNRPSSSSSSLRSLSMDSPDCSPFLFNISSSTSYATTNPDQPPPKEGGIDDPQTLMRPISTSPLHQAMQAFSQQMRNVQFPTRETEDAAMTKAILAVLSSSSPPPPPSSQQQQPPPQNIPSNYPLSQKSGAFKRYRSGFGLAPSSSTPMAARVQKQNMLKRAIILLKTLSTMRIQERVQGSRPTSTQLHHMMSERKRREKLNESFQALRSLLPPGTKKDKASVLTSTTEYLTSLKAQVAELSRRNESLEAQLLPAEREAADREVVGASSNERLHVQITQVAESTSEAQLVDLQVILRGECDMLDLVIRLLEFLKRVNNVRLISVEAATRVVLESNSVNRVMLRLKFEGGEWDEAAFQEAVRRVVADLAQ